jgi:hypothetical protein
LGSNSFDTPTGTIFANMYHLRGGDNVINSIEIALGTGTTANTFSSVEIYIPNYASSKAKSFSFDSVTENNATTALAMLGASFWSGTGAITNILVEQQGGSFSQYTTATLYGIL